MQRLSFKKVLTLVFVSISFVLFAASEALAFGAGFEPPDIPENSHLSKQSIQGVFIYEIVEVRDEEGDPHIVANLQFAGMCKEPNSPNQLSVGASSDVTPITNIPLFQNPATTGDEVAASVEGFEGRRMDLD